MKHLKMICLKCENEKFESKNVKVEQEFKGQNFNVVAKATVCTECGFFQFDDEQANMLRRSTVDTYKKNLSSGSDRFKRIDNGHRVLKEDE